MKRLFVFFFFFFFQAEDGIRDVERSRGLGDVYKRKVVDVDDIETLQDLILSAVNEGLRQSQQNMQNSLGQQIGKMTGGLDLSSILNPKS